jgi:hypothetical protein
VADVSGTGRDDEAVREELARIMHDRRDQRSADRSRAPGGA